MNERPDPWDSVLARLAALETSDQAKANALLLLTERVRANGDRIEQVAARTHDVGGMVQGALLALDTVRDQVIEVRRELTAALTEVRGQVAEIKASQAKVLTETEAMKAEILRANTQQHLQVAGLGSTVRHLAQGGVGGGVLLLIASIIQIALSWAAKGGP